MADASLADVCWPLGLERAAVIKQAKESKQFVNEFPEDNVLLIPDLLSSLLHSTYTHEKLHMIPESF